MGVALDANTFLASQFGTMIGDPLLMMILFIGFFIIFVMLQNTRLDGKIVILIPVLMLSMIFVSWMIVVVAFIVGIVIYMAITKFMAR